MSHSSYSNTCGNTNTYSNTYSNSNPTPTPSNCNGVEDDLDTGVESEESGDPDTLQPSGVVCSAGEDEPSSSEETAVRDIS